MNNVVYRSLIEEDYEPIKKLIGEAFGFNEFIKDKKCLDMLLSDYLKKCITASSFSKVAQKDGKVIGIILGNAKKDENRVPYSNGTLDFSSNDFDSVMSNEENVKFLKEFTKVIDIYDEFISGKEDNFQGCIQLFIISKESRGLGVGKTLVNYVFDYMKTMDVKSLYLYTDNRCNYGFYDYQNFNRLNEKEIYLDSIKINLNVFLYGYNF